MKKFYKVSLGGLIVAAVLVGLAVWLLDFVPQEIRTSIDKRRFVVSRFRYINDHLGNDIIVQNVEYQKKDNVDHVVLDLVAETDLFLIAGSEEKLEKYVSGDDLYVIDDIVPNPDNFFSVVDSNYHKSAVFLAKGTNRQVDLIFEGDSEKMTHFNELVQKKLNVSGLNIVIGYISKSALCESGLHSKAGLCDVASKQVVELRQEHYSLQQYLFKRID